MLTTNPLLKDAEKYPDELVIFSKVKGQGYFQGKEAVEIGELQFQEVDKIKKSLQDLNDNEVEEIIEMVYKVKIDYNKTRALEFYRAFNYVVEEIEQIIKREKVLSGKPSERLSKAGVNRLAVFDSLNLLDDIAVKYKTTPHEVEKWPYSNVFIYAYKMRVEDDIQKSINESEQ